MAHEIDMSNARANMACVGSTPWHGLGQSLTAGAPLETWAAEAGFEWSAIGAPVQFTGIDGKARNYGDKQVIYRSDTMTPLSVMGDTYKIVQPVEVLEFFRDLIDAGGWELNTAGALKGGRMLWAMASNGESAEVVENDSIENKLLLVTSLDGSLPTIAKMCSTRVVCWNTVQCALKDSGKSERVSHRSVFDATQVKRALGIAPESFAAFIASAKKMATQKIETEQAREVLRRIFGAPVTSKRVGVSVTGNATIDALLAAGALKEQRSVARCLELFAGAGMGAGLDGVQGTRWGLLNAVTQHIDHEQGRTDDNRLQSAWFGRGEDFKNSALELLTA